MQQRKINLLNFCAAILGSKSRISVPHVNIEYSPGLLTADVLLKVHYISNEEIVMLEKLMNGGTIDTKG
jgi:hypothetical protein